MRKEFRLSKYVEWMENSGYGADEIKRVLSTFDWLYEDQGKTAEEAGHFIEYTWCVDVEEEESDEDPLGHLFGDVKSIVATITINRK
jgi:hypothetical protein